MANQSIRNFSDYKFVKNYCELQFGQNLYPKKSNKLISKISRKSFSGYAEKGTDLYFAGRILCRMGIETFLFLFHQSIENYLKSFLILKKGSIGLFEHDLEKLLKNCTDEASNLESVVLTSKYLDFIVKKYNLFYEISRYPEFKKTGPSVYTLFIPEERSYMDLFILEMRKLLKLKPLKDENEFGLGFSNRFIISNNSILQKFLKEENMNFV